MTIDLTPEQLAWLRQILQEHLPETRVLAFGSRVTGTARPTSDLDLALVTDEALDLAAMASLREAFAESDLPMRVDLVDRSVISAGFWKLIQEQAERVV